MGVLEVIALVAELAPKVIAAGGAVADLYRTAAGILSDAENNGGKVDADAVDRLRALVRVQLEKLHENAKEARG